MVNRSEFFDGVVWPRSTLEKATQANARPSGPGFCLAAWLNVRAAGCWKSGTSLRRPTVQSADQRTDDLRRNPQEKARVSTLYQQTMAMLAHSAANADYEACACDIFFAECPPCGFSQTNAEQKSDNLRFLQGGGRSRAPGTSRLAPRERERERERLRIPVRIRARVGGLPSTLAACKQESKQDTDAVSVSRGGRA